MLKISSDLLSYKRIKFEMDTLNSYGDEGAYGNSDGISLEMKIPVEDIFYCSHLIGNELSKLDCKAVVETGEWVILNRSPTGLVEFPTSSIIIKGDMWIDERKSNIEYDKSYMGRYEPIVLRSRFRLDSYLGLTDIKPTLKNKIIQKLLSMLLKPAE